MSLNLRRLAKGKGSLTRKGILSLQSKKTYNDGRTIQSHADETDIVKIMARFAATGTISHLEKNQGSYADFSDFDFHTQMNMIARGETIFAELDAEIRKEFHQNPQEFFDYVNDPKNIDDLRKKLPGLAAPGRQLDAITPASADLDAAKALVKASEDAAKQKPTAEKAAEISKPAEAAE